MGEAEQLYDRLIAPIEGQLKAVALRIVRDQADAEDVIQETLADVWKRLHKIDRDANPHAYVLRICTSRAYDHLRRRAARRRRESKAALTGPGPASGTSDPAARLTTEDQAAVVRNAVGQLPPKQAKTVLLRASLGTSYPAIASILGCSPATARSHYSKGVARLREMLDGMDTA